VNYNIAPRTLLAVPLPIGKAKFFPLPERFYANYRFDRRQASTADRVRGTDSLVTRPTVSGHSGAINMGADSRPFEFLHHHIEAARNLNLRSPGLLGGRVHFGRVVTWSQSADAS
jgi:hypothetical protein